MRIEPLAALPCATIAAQRLPGCSRLLWLLGTSQSLLVLRIRYMNRHLLYMPYAAARAGAAAPPPAPAASSPAAPDLAPPPDPPPTLARSSAGSGPGVLNLLA